MKLNYWVVIGIVLFILSLSTINGQVPEQGVYYWNWSTQEDYWQGLTPTNNGVTSENSYPTFNTSGDSAPNSFNFNEGESDYLNWNDESLLTAGANNRSVSVWFYVHALPGASQWNFIFDYGTGSSYQQWGVKIDQGAGANPNKLCVGIYAEDQCTDMTMWTGQWIHAVVVQDGQDMNFYINGTLESTKTFSNTINTVLSNSPSIGSVNAGLYFDGNLDEFKYFNRSLTAIEVSNLYNYGNVSGPSVAEPEVNVTNLNVSFLSADLTIPNVTFATSTYTVFHEDEFNLSEARNVSLTTALEVTKLTVPTLSDVYVRVLHNGVVIKETLVRSVSGTNNIGVTGLGAIGFEAQAGQNNLTFEARRTGAGTIAFTNFDAILTNSENSEGVAHRSGVQSGSLTFSNTDFQPIFNWTRTGETSNTIVGARLITETDTNGNQSFRIMKTDGTTEYSPYSTRYTGTGSFGSVSINWISETPSDAKNFSLMAKTTGGTTTLNYSLFDLDFTDNFNNTVNKESNSNPQTNLTNTILLSTGDTLIANFSHTFLNGTGMTIGGVASLDYVSGTDTATMYILVNDSNVDCNNVKKRRTFIAGQSGNFNLVGICDGNMTIGNSYNFQLWINNPSANDLILFDENMGGFEITEFNLTERILNNSLFIQTSLINNTINFNDDELIIYYNFTRGEDSLFDLSDCSLVVNSITEDTNFNNTNNTNYNFTYTVPDVEADYTFAIECSNDETTDSTGDYNYKIDRIFPRLDTNLINNSQWFIGDIQTITNNVTDPNLIAYNFTLKDITGTVQENIFAENLTEESYINISSRTLNTAGNYTWTFTIWDSHTNNKVRPINWVFQQDTVVVDGNIYLYGDIKESKTQFYLNEKEDRYKFKIAWEQDALVHYLYIKNNHLKYVPDHGYMGHFVILEQKRWLDFEGTNVKNVTVIKQDNSTYLLEISLYKTSDEIEFESIGDLNTFEAIYSFTVISQDTALLSSIDDTLNELAGAVNMIWLVLLIGIIFAIGVVTKVYAIWSINGLFFGLISIYQGLQAIENSGNFFYWASTLGFFFLAIAIFFLGMGLQMVGHFEMKNSKSKYRDFYEDY